MDSRELMRYAIGARANSYAPYSHYNVGAALLCDDGTVVCGSNIENASYPASICAERSAISAAASSGKRRFLAIAIAGGAEDEKDVLSGYAMPCGICRQVMREFADPKSFKIYVGRSVDDIKEFTLAELLPESFGPDHLK
ncbi:MAG: cytidine deaminase [Lachnospiraceae bacterium]|nr:cytidine deaminase [Lachnospiraceae bacterium]